MSAGSAEVSGRTRSPSAVIFPGPTERWTCPGSPASVRRRCAPSPAASLTVLVSDVSLAEYGEAALRENLENLRLARRSRAGAPLRDRRRGDGCSRCCRPGSPPSTAATPPCAPRSPIAASQLRDALRRVGGRVEWGVKAYAAPERMLNRMRRRNRIGRSASRRCGSSSAQAMTGTRDRRGRRAGVPGAAARPAHRGRESRAAAVNAAQAVHADLSARAAGTRLHPPQSVQLSGVRLPMLLNAAYLIDAADGVSFTAAVAAQATAHPELRDRADRPVAAVLVHRR